MDAALGAAVAGAATVYLSGKSTEVAAAAVDTAKEVKEELQQLVNWSGTHHVRPKRFYQPETTEEVEDIVRRSHEQGMACALPMRPTAYRVVGDRLLIHMIPVFMTIAKLAQ